MSFKTEEKNNCTIITLSTDKLDAIVAPDLKSEFVLINKKGNNNIIVDMENVRYCDSSGLSALLTGHRFCREAGSVFLLNALQTNVKKMVVISRLDTVFTIKNTMKEALDFLFVEEIERKLGNK